nr:retrovirus-related Pol polyprotein from transposon TNT 1-94 [Tanacetum cinerariifolium]
MTTLVEFMILSVGDDRPPMLDKDLVSKDLWEKVQLLMQVITSRFPSTNNQLRKSPNLRQQATIHDGRVTVQPLQGEQILMLLVLQEQELILQEHEGIIQVNKGLRNVLTTKGKVIWQDNAQSQRGKEMLRGSGEKVLLHLLETQNAAIQDTNSSSQQDAMILSMFEQLSQQVINCNKVNKDKLIANESLSAKLERYKEQALSFQNPFYLKKAQQIRPMLYDGNVIAKETNMILIADSEETLMLEEENFGKRFVPQQELSAKQAFWFQMSNPSTKSSDASLVKVDVPSELPKVSLVNASLKKLKFYLTQFDSMVKKRITPNSLIEGDRSQLTNFVNKFLKRVKFSNNQIAKIMGYGDYKIENVTISKVYYVEGLGHNLFSVGQFCDSDLEVAFRVFCLQGVDLLSGSQETNLYTLSVRDRIASSPICLLSKASKPKSWLWHRRLSHLNFGATNHLARNGLV